MNAIHCFIHTPRNYLFPYTTHITNENLSNKDY